MGGEQEVQLEEAEGRMVNLSCEAQGHPLPSVSWNVIGSQVRLPALTHFTAVTCDEWTAGKCTAFKNNVGGCFVL